MEIRVPSRHSDLQIDRAAEAANLPIGQAVFSMNSKGAMS